MESKVYSQNYPSQHPQKIGQMALKNRLNLPDLSGNSSLIYQCYWSVCQETWEYFVFRKPCGLIIFLDWLWSWLVNLLLASHFDRSHSIVLKMKSIKISMLFSCFSCYQCVVSHCVFAKLSCEIVGEMPLEPLFTIQIHMLNQTLGYTHFQSQNEKHFHFYWLIFLMNTKFLPF